MNPVVKTQHGKVRGTAAEGVNDLFRGSGRSSVSGADTVGMLGLAS